MGREEQALTQARINVGAWSALENLDAIIINTSGCGTTVKDYGFMLRGDPVYAEKAAHISSLTNDITEFLAALPLTPKAGVPELACLPLGVPVPLPTEQLDIEEIEPID